MQQRIVRAALIAIAGLAVVGCATTPGGQGRSDAVPAADIVDGYDCLATALDAESLAPNDDAPARGRVPAGFQPVAAYLCAPFVAPDGSNTVDVFEGDLTELVTALDEPDDPPQENVACTADMEIVSPLWLADAAGRAVHVHYPRDVCNKTKPGVHEALAELTLTETVTVG